MTKLEKQIILDKLEESHKAMMYYYKEGTKTGEWKNHEIACATLGAVREIAEALGLTQESFGHKYNKS